MRIDDTRPIWIQLADSFRGRITDGTWKPGEKITNPNTVQRALSALDEEGLTVPKRTAGRFVATDERALHALRKNDAHLAADAYIRACRSLGIDLEGARALIDQRWDATEK